MKKPNFLKSPQKKSLLKELKEIYGIQELPYLLIKSGKKKIRAYSGSLSKEEISLLSNLTNVEIIGIYTISKKDAIPRINFDALTIPEIKNQINKNIIEINNEQLQLWLRGNDLEIKNAPPISIIKFQDDFVGIGKSNSLKIFNYLPKERKLKTPLPS